MSLRPFPSHRPAPSWLPCPLNHEDASRKSSVTLCSLWVAPVNQHNKPTDVIRTSDFGLRLSRFARTLRALSAFVVTVPYLPPSHESARSTKNMSLRLSAFDLRPSASLLHLHYP
jgi:hypothetical protein